MSKPFYSVLHCNNGTRLSVQASMYHHCKPKNDTGPYTHFELSYWTNKGLPRFLCPYIDESIFSRVPSNVILQLIELNGGLKEGEMPPYIPTEAEDYEEYFIVSDPSPYGGVAISCVTKSQLAIFFNNLDKVEPFADGTVPSFNQWLTDWLIVNNAECVSETYFEQKTSNYSW